MSTASQTLEKAPSPSFRTRERGTSAPIIAFGRRMEDGAEEVEDGAEEDADERE